MEQINRSPEYEVSHLIVTPPVEEIFLDPGATAGVWPELLQAYPSLHDQLVMHTETVTAVDTTLTRLASSNYSILEAIDRKLIPEAEAAALYDHLVPLLADRDTYRLGLYLPFELIPDQTWQPANQALAKSLHRFREQYRDTWFNLLGAKDVRANFVDGDIHEDGYQSGNYERVVKAAHLVPIIIERGICSVDSIIDLRIVSRGQLRKSLDEGLAAYYRIPIRSASSNQDEERPVSENRQNWLMQVAQDQRVTKDAHDITRAILEGTYVPQNSVWDDSTKQSFIEGVYGTLEKLHTTDTKRTEEVLARYYPLIASAWNDASTELENRLSGIYRRLHRLGIIDRAEIDKYKVKTSDLAAPFSHNLEAIQPDIDQLQMAIARIQSDPQLSTLLYPLIAVGGSRVKGYGEATSDIDVSVFIRPGVSYEDYESVRKRIEEVFQGYEPMEFWLSEDTDGLYVHDMATPQLHTADSSWTHCLFTTAWIGATGATSELRQQLLPRYFAATGNESITRPQYMERLEQDVVQYRLMHKGYTRHYPLRPRDPSLYGEAIDGRSVFWDSGFRYLATRLFVQHVFLPKLG